MKIFYFLAAFSAALVSAIGASTPLSSPVFTNLNKKSFIVDYAAVPTNIVKVNLRGPGQPDGPGDIWTFMSTNVFTQWTNTGSVLRPTDTQYKFYIAPGVISSTDHSQLGTSTEYLSGVFTENLLWARNGFPGGDVFDSFGPGSPEGVVVASPGSIWRDTTGGGIYHKATGVGDTGWEELGVGLWEIVSGNLQPIDSLYRYAFGTNATFSMRGTNNTSSATLTVNDNLTALLTPQDVIEIGAGVNALTLDTTSFVGTGGFAPFAIDLGTKVTAWNNIWSLATNHIIGFYPGGVTNYAGLDISHTGTNGAALFLSLGDGIAGQPRPFRFDTDNPILTGNLAEFANDNTNWMTLGGNLQAVLSLHATVGNPAIIASQDSFTFSTGDAGGGAWQLGTTVFHPTSDGIAEIGGLNQRIQDIFTGSVIWGAGGATSVQLFDAAGAATPEGVVTADPGSIWRNTGGGSGTTFWGKETGTNNTGWTAFSMGGGGDTLWYTYTAPDAEGGTIYGTASTNSIQTNIVNFAVNNLTNFWGAPTFSAIIGDPATDLASLISSSVFVFGYGHRLFESATMTNCDDIFAFGDTLYHQTLMTNSFDVYGFGIFSFDQSSMDHASYLFGYGDDSMATSHYVNSANIYGFGHETIAGASSIDSSSEIYATGFKTLESSSITNSSRLFASGYRSQFGSVINNSSEIYSYGGMDGATISNSSRLTSIGGGAGDGISGAYTNVVLIGDGATLGSTGKDRIITGPAMGMEIGSYVSAGTTNQWKTGPVATGLSLTVNLTNAIVITVNGTKYYQLIANETPP